MTDTATGPRVASAQEWLEARRRLLDDEVALSEARREVERKRRELPMVRVDKDYVFTGPDGERATLADLFDGRRQLLVYHFMFDPSWDDGCSSCTPFVQGLGRLDGLHEQDTTLVLVSRAPQDKLQAYRRKMGWTVPWFSSGDGDFNYDFHATLDESRAPIMIDFRDKAEHERTTGPADMYGHEIPGISVFLRDGDTVYHTYSTGMSGGDGLMFPANFLGLTPSGGPGAE